jgi:hypothetical protein
VGENFEIVANPEGMLAGVRFSFLGYLIFAVSLDIPSAACLYPDPISALTGHAVPAPEETLVRTIK